MTTQMGDGNDLEGQAGAGVQEERTLRTGNRRNEAEGRTQTQGCPRAMEWEKNCAREIDNRKALKNEEYATLRQNEDKAKNQSNPWERVFQNIDTD
eukprot:CAMPEP_0170479104 /NCGR_PEP_ID=MMETSP0208-20121228/452_1 /TAXON_ID=197538 /ORGANISM="Strombidium inclinatum, Strain S3" /LENGTH=95 /DNA_ID=CAMNT_0010751447 /DNA_START=203 /DNA_END=492 /DNA_ORIENTATION=-